jgi:hypothetical protein
VDVGHEDSVSEVKEVQMLPGMTWCVISRCTPKVGYCSCSCFRCGSVSDSLKVIAHAQRGYLRMVWDATQ